jgi:hypothetical protein
MESALTIRLIPADVLEEVRRKIHKGLSSFKKHGLAAGIIGAIWLLLLIFFIKILVSVI